jgi:hypothetical protein
VLTTMVAAIKRRVRKLVAERQQCASIRALMPL